MNRSLMITGPCAEPVLNFIRLADDRWFGGRTDMGRDLFPGPHFLLYSSDLFELIADLSRRPDGPYTLHAAAAVIVIGPVLDAARLAAALDCDEQAVRDYFEPLVTIVPAAAEAAGCRAGELLRGVEAALGEILAELREATGSA